MNQNQTLSTFSNIPNPADKLEALTQDWFLQKAIADAERAKLVAIEAQILQLLDGQVPERGQKTFKAGVYNMTIKTDITHKLRDKEVYQGLMASGEVPDVFAPTLSESKVNALIKAGVFGRYAKHFESRPSKPAFTVVQARI